MDEKGVQYIDGDVWMTRGYIEPVEGQGRKIFNMLVPAKNAAGDLILEQGTASSRPALPCLLLLHRAGIKSSLLINRVRSLGVRAGGDARLTTAQALATPPRQLHTLFIQPTALRRKTSICRVAGRNKGAH